MTGGRGFLSETGPGVEEEKEEITPQDLLEDNQAVAAGERHSHGVERHRLHTHHAQGMQTSGDR